MRVRTPFRCSPHPCEYEIAFVSDVEGDLDYFNRWVAGSRCVAYTGSDEAALTLTHARAYFVYRGDVPDHGCGSERLLRLLVPLDTGQCCCGCSGMPPLPEVVLLALHLEQLLRLGLAQLLDLEQQLLCEDLAFIAHELA